ncbi:UPF0175 family protein [candidate division CSSED10-310 bacterium]|uniref:UPF0175 family protein n=1 Tax=candidate division CSSED10-310 bacterium TaxID=2855610 RepID=A0ABV6YYF0_UNCC1
MGSNHREIKISIPVEVLLSASMTEEQITKELREMLAFKLFSEGKLTSGNAAKLIGMSRVAFLFEASRRGIDILSYSENELHRELA